MDTSQLVTNAVTDISESTGVTSETTTGIIDSFSEKARETGSVIEKLSTMLNNKLPDLILAAFILIFGILVIKVIKKFTGRIIDKGNIDKTAGGFLKSFIKVILDTILVIVVLNALGVPMASIIAVVGAAGLALSLALQQSLSNVAGGFIILFSKPFKVGDIIEFNDVTGKVENISILYTKIVSFDNKVSHIPNGVIANAKITNRTEKTMRRLELTYSIGYGDDYKKAKELISGVLSECKNAVMVPEPVVGIAEHGASAIIIDVKVWTNTDNYYALKYELNEKIKDVFDENGINIPYNQLDVHLIGEKKEK